MDYRYSYRRRLPHIQPPGATLFVTTRLAGSLPAEVQRALHDEAEQIRVQLAQERADSEQVRRLRALQKQWFGRWDAALDCASSGPVWLQQGEVAAMVAEALHHFDGQRYDLLAYCIMPNHVHLLLTPLPQADGTYHAIAAIMHGFKGYTAQGANQRLGRRGPFWQEESYDHFVRDASEHERIVAYIVNNPVKAGLVAHWEEWKWTYQKL